MGQRVEVVARVEATEEQGEWDQNTKTRNPSKIAKRIAHVVGEGFNAQIECDARYFHSLKLGELYDWAVDVDAQKTDNGAKLVFRAKFMPALVERAPGKLPARAAA